QKNVFGHVTDKGRRGVAWLGSATRGRLHAVRPNSSKTRGELVVHVQRVLRQRRTLLMLSRRTILKKVQHTCRSYHSDSGQGSCHKYRTPAGPCWLLLLGGKWRGEVTDRNTKVS
ncbi:unnamed protein product, partial [Ectocarpus sp. 13 AM-2016]